MKTIFNFLILTFISFSLFSCSNNSDETVNDNHLITEYNSSDDELELARLINLYRVSIGKNELQIINHISYKSQEHNMYMIENNVVNHAYFQSRANNIKQVLGAVTVGENVAYNFSTPNAALHAWLNSPGHKASLDADFTHFGISISINQTNGKKYYTNIFMKR